MEELLRGTGSSFAFEEETRYLHRISIRGRGPCENVVFVGCDSEFEPRNPLQMEELLREIGGSFAFEKERIGCLCRISIEEDRGLPRA